MPDEEPPERGLAELMAAARVKADAMTRPSWLQRMFAVLRKPPVLALATVMVLLGGVVLIGKRKEQLEPTPPPRIERPTISAPTGSAAVGGAPTEAPVDEVKPAEALEREKREEPTQPTPPRPARRHAPASNTATTPSPPPPRVESAKKPATSFDDDTKLESDSAPGAMTGGEAQAAEPPKASAAPKQDRATPVSQYFTQARTAATRGDCAAARVLAGRIAKQDAQYYRDVVVNDATIKKCLVTVAQ